MEFFNSIQQVKSNWQPYKKWEKEQDDKDFQRQELYKRVPASKEDLENASQYGRTIVDAINVMDQYSINKAEDVEMTTKLANSSIQMAMGLGTLGIGALAYKMSPKIKHYVATTAKNNPMKLNFVVLLASLPLPLTIMPFFTVKFASYEKEASRIARYQAREEKLKDSQNFIIYDEDQIEEAKKIAKTLPNPIEKKKPKFNPIVNYGDSIKSIKILIKDHDNYLKWKDEHLKHEKAKNESFDAKSITPEQLQNAKKDQDNLLRIIRKIEISSQNYLANTEMAFNIVLESSLIAGLAGGGIVSGITGLLQKLKVVSKSSKLAQNTKKLAPLIGMLGLTIGASSTSIKLQKEAAKIGRFKAKQELLNDPHNFISYSDEQMESVQDFKAPPKPHKGLIDNIKDNFKFFFQLKKDFKEYEKYEKTEYKEEQKLQEALKSVKASNKQIKDAKALQKNAFMSFEKMDEMTQRYVDDTEAAADIGKQYINAANTLITMAIMLALITKNPKKITKSNGMLIAFSPAIASVIIQTITEIKTNQIKKEAGKIGTMKAMKDLEDPKHFIQES